MDDKLSQFTFGNKDLTCYIKDEYEYESTLTTEEKDDLSVQSETFEIQSAIYYKKASQPNGAISEIETREILDLSGARKRAELLMYIDENYNEAAVHSYLLGKKKIIFTATFVISTLLY